MSQPRTRKANDSRSCAPAGKASGDTVPCNIGIKPQNKTSSSKNKIPKSIRYDLESALVSLCDLWFEDIKPHLVKNNIKLHVHGAGPGSASGDHGRIPPGAHGCSHLDPGAASDVRALLHLALHVAQRRRSDARCVDCYSMRRTASKVPCLRPRTRQHLSPPFPVPPRRPSSLQMSPPHATSNNNRGCDDKMKPRSRRRSREYQVPSSLPQSSWRVPRLCRTYSTLSSTYCSPSIRMPFVCTASQPQHTRVVSRGGNFLRQRKPKVKMKHKSTQTESIVCLSEPKATTDPTSPRSCCPGAMPIPYEYKKSDANCHQSRRNAKPLFSQDLVNIIADKYDKNLRLLYRSPQRKDCASINNLMGISDDRSNKPASAAKKKPWR